MLQKKPLALAVSAALGFGVAVFGLPVMAQDSAQVLEEVVVTGSRIKRADLASASPVTVLSREDLKATGITDIGDLIQSMPSMSGSPIGTTTNNGGDGSVQVDLRGLGASRTLNLVNGRRTVDGGDYQTIPAAMIERVEILKDGASAVYGADAVAGVVNVITRKDFEGAEIEAQSSDWDKADRGKQDTLSVVFGKGFEGGHFMFGAEYVKQQEAYQSDVPWGHMQDTYYIYPEGCEKQPSSPYDGSASGGCYPLGSSRIEEGRLRFADGETYMNEGNGLVPYDGRTYNYAPGNYLQTPYERFNVFSEGSVEITDNVRAFLELRGNLRDSSQELAPTPLSTETDPAYDGVWEGTPYSGISEQNYYLAQALTAAGLPVLPVTNARRRMSERARSFDQDVTQWQGVFGLAGQITQDIDWELSYNRGVRTITSNDFGQYFGPNLANALGPSADLDGDGTPECYQDLADPTSVIAGCVPMNLVGGPGTVTDDMYNYVQANLTDHLRVEQEIWEFFVSGSSFELPGGALGWSVGAFHQEQDLNNSPDSGKQLGQVTGNTGGATVGSLEVNSAYLELLAPVFNNGAQALDVKLGLRHDDYSAFAAEDTWQIGLDFQVIKGLRLRGTAGSVFRAPTIDDLYGGSSDSFPSFSDPCAADPPAAGCAQQSEQLDSQVLTQVGGNPNLTPETGDTYTVGVVWTPEFVSGDLSVTVDYWDIQFEDAISSLGADFILEECYVNGLADACALVTRDADYEVSLVKDLPLNVAEEAVNGVDTEIRYTFGLDQFGLKDKGEMRLSFLWAHLLERSSIPFDGAEKTEYRGRYAGSAFAEDKFNYSVAWNWNNLTVSYLGEYISKLDADTFCNCDSNPYIQKIDDMLYHDVVASYTFASNTSITAGVTNLTNEEAPFIETGFNATTDPSTYRMFGRGYYLRLNQKF
jgi:outer membrane receptor protein involved in Fe transport